MGCRPALWLLWGMVACTGRTLLRDPPPGNVCGDGTREGAEICDGDCPEACAKVPCAEVQRLGSPKSCDARCVVAEIHDCRGGDACCPSGCDANSDEDCAPLCGNRVVETGETCDGDCPGTCAPEGDCSVGSLAGSECTRRCSYTEITACVDQDDCCPDGCNSGSDDDCAILCGNGITERGETCDGDCPTSCGDGRTCTRDVMLGSAARCAVSCHFPAIVTCADADGCCPSACTDAAADADCRLALRVDGAAAIGERFTALGHTLVSAGYDALWLANATATDDLAAFLAAGGSIVVTDTALLRAVDIHVEVRGAFSGAAAWVHLDVPFALAPIDLVDAPGLADLAPENVLLSLGGNAVGGIWPTPAGGYVLAVPGNDLPWSDDALENIARKLRRPAE
jgi:hypothetical protein